MSKQPAATTKDVSNGLIAIALSLVGAALLVLFRIGSRAEAVADIVWLLKLVALQSPFYLAAVWLCLRGKDDRSLLVVGLLFAALFRLSIIFSPPYLSDDIYRYVWDGRVQAAGVNPYRYVPADQSLAALRDERIYPKINRREYARTMYPPVAEGVFLVTTRLSESVTWMKATMIAFEAVAVWAIIQLLVSFGLPRQRVFIYAWHPLVVWEFAGSGHLDAIAIAFIALALLAHRRNAEPTTGVLLACATLVKIFPVVLLPALFRRWSWRLPFAFALTIAVAYLPYLSVGPLGVLGFLPGYAGERGMISGEQYFLLDAMRRLSGAHVPTAAYLVCVVVILFALSVWLIRNQQDLETGYIRSALIIASVFMLLLAPHFPWYFCWLVPFLCFIPSLSVFYLTLASFLLYLTWLNDAPESVFKLKALIFLPFLFLATIAFWLRSARGAPGDEPNTLY